MNLSGKISRDDIDRVSNIRNHPQYQDGFDDGGDAGGGFDISDDDFNFDSLDGAGSGGSDPFGGGGSSDPFGGFGSSTGTNDPFGGSNSDPFGGFGNNNNSFGSGFGADNGFGSSFGNGFGANNGFGDGFGSGFGGQQNGAQAVQEKDTTDKLIDATVDTAKSLGAIMMEMIKSVKLRNADDYGYLSHNLIITGAFMVPISIIIGIFGSLTKIKILSFAGLSLQFALCGAFLVSFGIIGIGLAALVLQRKGAQAVGNFGDIPDIPPEPSSNAIDPFESNIGSEVNDLFGDDFDNLFADLDSKINDEPEEATPEEPEDFNVSIDDVEPEEIDFKAELDKISENVMATRESLFNAFKGLFPTNTPKFTETKELDKSSEDFKSLEAICLKALANIANCEFEELDSQLESATETFFSYELKLKRINKVKKTDELAREIEAYTRDSSEDEATNATVDIEGDFYKIIITKGQSAVITFGDVFKQQYCCDFFLNNKNKLPIISGIDELGNVILDDAKNFDTMLIAGKPRSGKSWYLLSILMSMMLFNSPELVQFIIIDPKESNLFKTIALMPHVCGLHTDEDILTILDDIINIEAPRRKKILSDHRCDDIWALRKKGVNLPVLYLVIDEYMTVIGNLADDKDKIAEFNTKMRVLISQLPSQGIRLMFVPHRATGVVDKTNRTMIQFTACVRSDSADVIDTLGIKKWDRALTQPGDIAYKSSSSRNAKYVRGAALTCDDGENTLFIETAAKAFYKMGVNIPDMSCMRIACNRDEKMIHEELDDGTTRVQYDVNNVFDNIDEA